MKKIISGVLVAIFVFFAWRVFTGRSDDLPVVPIPLIEPPAPRHYTDAFPQLPIRFYSWKEPDPYYAQFALSQYTESRQSSPSNKYSAVRENQDIQIVDLENDDDLYSVPLEEETVETQFFWISDELLVIIEKPQDGKEVDDFYIIDVKEGEKQFFTGSFVIPSRLNLQKQIGVYAEGHVLIMEDNEEKLWQLDVMY